MRTSEQADQDDPARAAVLAPHVPVRLAGDREPVPVQVPIRSKTKLLLIDVRGGRPAAQHPDVDAYLRDGWQIRRIEPRISPVHKAQHLVVLVRTEEKPGPATPSLRTAALPS